MARIALGSDVREGPRRGQVVGHRPKGMVDVQFDDVGWVERRQEKGLRKANPAGKGDYYDPAKEQFRRQQMAIYESQKKRGKVTVYDSDGYATGKRPMTDDEAWQSSFAIATRVGQKHGWLKKGTQEPTAKGRGGAKQKLKDGDAWAKRQKYELELSKRRKSGKHRVVPQRHGKQTRYYVQPGGRYFYGKGAKKRAMALRDELNGAKMKGRKRKAANPGYPVRENWLPAAAAVLTIADVGYRAVKDKKKRKDTENPRYLDERGGMARGTYKLHAAARSELQQATNLGRLKGLRELAYQRIQGKKQKHQKMRAVAQVEIDQVDREFDRLIAHVTSQIPSRPSGLRSEAQSKAMGALRRAYSGAYHDVLNAQEEKRRKRRKVSNPDHGSPGPYPRSEQQWRIEEGLGRKTTPQKRSRGIASTQKGFADYWATISTTKKGEYIPPKIFQGFGEDGENVYYIVFEGRNQTRLNFIMGKIRESNRFKGYGPGWKKDKRVTNLIFKDKPGSMKMRERYRITLPKSGKGSKRDPYRIYDMKTDRIVFTATLKPEAEKRLRKLQGKVVREFVGKDGPPIHAYYTTSPQRVSLLIELLEERGIIPERSAALKIYRGEKTKFKATKGSRVAKSKYQQALDKELAELEALEAQLARLKANPRRKNGLATVGRGVAAGAKWLVKSKTGKAILAEAAIIGTMVVGEKLMSQGKVSPKVMKYIQARVEKETGRRPTQSEVRKVLKEVDPNKDQTLTADEVARVLKRKKVANSRRR